MSADGGAHLVDRRRHCAAEAGDEPLLLARVANTVVARDRPTGAMLALAGGASLIVMDDGLQNPSLRRDFTLAVIDGGVGFGNGRLLPAGPLRAPIDLQLNLTSAGLVIGEGEAGEKAAALLTEAGKPVFHGRLAPDANAALRMLGSKVVAFAGIGRPQKFFDSLGGQRRAACRAPRLRRPSSLPSVGSAGPAAAGRGARRAAGDDGKGHGQDRDLPGPRSGATCRNPRLCRSSSWSRRRRS